MHLIAVVSDSLLPHGLQPARLLCPWDSPDRYTGVGCHALLQGNLPDPGIEPRSPALQADSLLSGPPGKPENTGVGSLSLLQGIFPTQESSWGLLHCRQILYQLSYYYPFLKFYLFKFLLFLIEDSCFTTVVLLSAKHQHEISNRYTYGPSLLNPSPTSYPIPPL